MIALSKISARIFASVAYAALRLTGWKKKTVEANLSYVSRSSPSEQPSCAIQWNEATKNLVAGYKSRELYRQMLKNLTRHVGELLFRFKTYKNLPNDPSAYPCKKDGWNFEIGEGSAEVIRKMRKGGIFLTAHFGNYEASGAWLCALDVPLKASFIPLKPAWLNQIVYRKIRCVQGRPYSIDAQTPRDFLRVLDQGELFCLLADQDSRIGSAMDGTFLGRPVRVNPVPDFILKHRPETPVFFCWIEEPHGTCRKILHAEEVTQEQLKSSAENSVVDGPYKKWLEKRILENPAQWYGWTHRRFRSANPEIYP